MLIGQEGLFTPAVCMQPTPIEKGKLKFLAYSLIKPSLTKSQIDEIKVDFTVRALVNNPS